MFSSLDPDTYRIFSELLDSQTKTTMDSGMYMNLNTSIDYNSVLSRMIELCDDSITALIEGDTKTATDKLTQVFFNNGQIYDYIIQSGIYNSLAKQFDCPLVQLSYIPDDQKIIIKDTRNIQTRQIPLQQIEDYYDSVHPIA